VVDWLIGVWWLFVCGCLVVDWWLFGWFCLVAVWVGFCLVAAVWFGFVVVWWSLFRLNSMGNNKTQHNCDKTATN